MEVKFRAPEQLSDVQSQVLLLVLFAPTPAAATDNIKQNPKAAAASAVLGQRGLIATTPSGTIITDKGIQLLDSLNLVDSTGQRTELGDTVFARAIDTNNSVAESWPLISSVSQLV